MARLNEPQSSVENVEALRRRANSAQSLRIRNLEAEISRLLAENVSLREQVIKLQAQADRDRGRQVLENVEGIKRMIEGKIRELGDLVGGLGAASLDISPRASRARRSPGKDQKNWKNTFTLSEVTSNHEGRLPPILEDKMYPRRSIDSNELYPPRSDPPSAPDSSLSPELGPPPIAHFEEEPIKFDPNGRASVESILGTGVDDGIAFLPVNLETRKKRRDSARLSEILKSTDTSQHGQRQSSTAENQVANGDTSQPSRTSAKRKLSVRDEDEKPEKNLSADFDDFKFSRRVTTGRGKDEHRLKTNSHSIGSKGSNESTQESEVASNTSGEKRGRHNTTASDRKALGPKSTNIDLASSPLKNNKVTLLEDVVKKDVAKKTAAIEHSKVRERRPTATAARPKHKEPDVKAVNVESESTQNEPETPCPPDLFSPVGSQPSTARPISRDTPPPPDLDPSLVTADGLSLAARATRRPRVSVNYAEPNLRDKMRRPTKELVDAVIGEGKGHRMSGVKMEGNRSADEEGSSNDKNQIRTVVIKRERDDGSDQSWRKLQPSSLGDKEPSTLLGRAYKTVKARESGDGSPLSSRSSVNTQSELPNSIITQRRRRTSTLHQGDEDFAGEQSASAAALSELGGNSNKTGDKRTDIAIQNAMEKLKGLGIYDFKGSSPTAGDSAAESSTSRTSHRRSPEDDVSDTDAVSGNGSLRRGGRRRQTLTVNTQGTGDPSASVRAARSVATLRGSKGSGEEDAEGTGGGTGGRAAGRRRSMVL
ncbi:MAG: hypothetical protein M1839_008771 [Geoglossum umbratile]|nr:MAG: hypothetical protein M1839_008771 [Geoglossum umbratile]